MGNRSAFLALVKAGLWNTEVPFSHDDTLDFTEILRLADEQSVIGLVTTGVEKLPAGKLPLMEKLTFLGKCQLIEQWNESMNRFIAGLVKRMQEVGIKVVLVKGQGVAQCYEKPLWRTSGDIDLLLDEENYNKAKAFLTPLSDKAVSEDIAKKHLSVQIGGFTIELHGRMPFAMSKRADRVINGVVAETCKSGCIRIWCNEDTSICLPNADNDVLLVFTHYLNHFFIEGVGLKQIFDWCRLLWSFRDELDKGLLENRLHEARLMSEWKVFASLAVNNLGMPQEAMPLYDDSSSYRRKANRALSHIIKSGNLGHNHDVSYRAKHSAFASNIITFFRRLTDFIKFTLIFPIDSPRFFMSYMISRWFINDNRQTVIR